MHSLAVNKKIKLLLVLCLLLVTTISFSTMFSATTVSTDAVAFVNVNVIPMDTERLLMDQTVITQGDRIIKIGDTDSVTIPNGALIIEGRDHYLIPGLADMHQHIDDNIDSLKLYIANGVTTVRDFNSARDILRLRAQIESSEILGPQIWAGQQLFGLPTQMEHLYGQLSQAIGPMLETNISAIFGFVVEGPEHARELVLRAKSEGFDFIKSQWFLGREEFDAIMKTAKEIGMPVVGHIAGNIGAEHFIRAGGNPEHDYQLLSLVAKDYVPTEGPNPLDVFDLSEFEQKLPALVNLMVESGVVFTPTLITSDTIYTMFDNIDNLSGSPLFQKPEYQYVPAEYFDAWTNAQEGEYRVVMEARGVTDIREILPAPEYRDAVLKIGKRIVKALHDGGVPIFAGTDSSDPGVVWGFSLHHEFELLFSAGLTPFEVLETATRAPSEFLGNPEEWGTVKEGKRADLVLLSANPLENISNTRRIAGVMVSGRWMSQPELQGMLDALAAKYEAHRND